MSAAMIQSECVTSTTTFSSYVSKMLAKTTLTRLIMPSIVSSSTSPKSKSDSCVRVRLLQ